MDILASTIESFGGNNVLWVSFISWFAAQLIKVIIEILQNKKLDFGLFISSGGMPSSHSSLVTGMTTSIAIQEGLNSNLFALSAIMSMVVMYDAAGVRRAAGKQAEAINLIMSTIENQNIKLDKKLKELIGHTPIQVACGAVLGILIGIITTKTM